MRRSRPTAPAVLIGAVMLLSGCASGSDVPSVPSAPADVVPVTDARDARGHDPCGLVGTEQATRLDVSMPGRPGPAPEGPSCAWSGTGGRSLRVTFFTDGDGLGTLAANSEPSTTKVRVEGYPALETFTGAGEFCQYDIGIADEQAVMVVGENLLPDSCDALQAVIPGLLGKLPPATG